MSDLEREAVVEELRVHAVAGRLDADELAARAEQAYSARTVLELTNVLRDLPKDRRSRVTRRRLPRSPFTLPAAGTACAAAATVVTASIDGGFRGPLDGVAAVPFWLMLASGGLLVARFFGARIGVVRLRRTRKPA